MSSIPPDLQRRLEQRRAARFARSAPAAVPQGRRPESQRQPPAAPANAKRKPAGLSRRASGLLQQFERGTEAPRRVSGLHGLRLAVPPLALGAWRSRAAVNFF
jgi:hypothetical protein